MKFYIQFFLCGISTGFLFPPFFLIPLGFIIFPFLFYLITNKEYIAFSAKKHFFSGLLYGFGFFSIYLIWIKDPFYIDDLTKNYSLFSYILIFYCSIYFGTIFLIMKYIKKKLIKFFVFPILIVISEFICANFSYGFPWYSFALVHSIHFLGTSLVYYVGTYGLSYLTILSFLLPTLFFFKSLKNSKFVYLFLTLLVFLICLILYFKYNKKDNIENNFLSISIVQLSYPLNQFLDEKNKKRKFNEIIDIIKNDNSDILIFGENDYPYLMNNYDILNLQNIIKDEQTVIIGSTRLESTKYFNSLFMIKNNVAKKFDKKILVPFGEFIPFRSIFNFMEFIGGTEDFSKGNDIRLIEINNKIKILPIICYEIIFFWKLIEKKLISTNLIINITNDSWFGDLSGPYQHFYFSKLRAAEFNKVLIRSSNSGVSGVIDNYGQIVGYIGLKDKQIKQFKINLDNNKVNYIKLHNYYFLLILLFLFICIFLDRRDGFRKI